MKPAANSRPLAHRTLLSALCASVLLRALLVAAAILIAATPAHAGGPRWFSGPPYFNTWYVDVAWYTNTPAYFTDPGDLSASVDHAHAESMVAAAASVWNIPTASLVLARGGALNEHVSSANISAASGGLGFPADVAATNYASKQIAVIYDSDGSVTDLLLGAGASDPSGCLQNGVTESVDLISHEGQIQHAMLILNGRCTGPEPEKQLQMQYQLERAFGRILGLGWSQTNDNVFTGSPTPTATQALNWPIMHPIDIVCGPYSYQCLPQPFTLRPDDISSLEMLYFIRPGQAGPGKQASWTNAGGVYGNVHFPNGQGMEGVNVVVRRRAPFWDTAEDWQTASSVAGFGFRGQSSTSIVAPDTSIQGSLGAPGADWEGTWVIQSVPIPANQDWTDLLVSTEPINPLYSGPYAIGPQSGNTMSPSGSPQVQVSQYLANGRNNLVLFNPPDAAGGCTAGADGTEGAPLAAPQQGWWTGTLCGYQHQAWNSVSLKANRTVTLEVTALDESGSVSMTKAMPIIGAWKSTDPSGTLPTVAVAAKAFNSLSVGLTALHLQSASSSTSFRIAIADQRGAGRPDFAYQSRVLYADSVSPASLPADGGSITISGMGFRQGNLVLINGVPAAVSSWTANTIVATAPSLHTLGLSRATVASITVQDASTGGSSIMTRALTYAAPVEALMLVSAPAGTFATGTVIPTSFTVKAIAPDGFTPIVGEAVSFSVTGATLAPCASATCTILTNAAGVASAGVTPTAQGTVRLTATGRSGSATASFNATASKDVLRLISAPATVTTVGMAAGTPLGAQLLASDGTTPRSGSAITLTVTAGAAHLSACNATPCTLTTDAQGMVSTVITPTSSGTVSIQFTSLSGSVAANITAATRTIHLVNAPSGTLTEGVVASAFQVKILAGDGLTPIQGDSIVLAAAGGIVAFAACGGPVCTLTTDTQGIAQSSLTPLSAGLITLSAMGNAGTVSATFQAVPPPDVFHSVTAPAGILYLGDATPAVFAVRITAADGVTPVAGKPVSFSVSSGAAIFGTCGSQSCTVLTDATGVAATSVSPTSAGQVSLLATSEAGTLTATVTAAARVRSITIAQPVLYVAEGATLSWQPLVTLSDNSGPVAGVPVLWTGTTGLIFSPTSSAGTPGLASGTATAGPLSAGARVQGTACAWTSVCSSITVLAVAAGDWRFAAVHGTSQSVPSSAALTPVTLRVVDLEGNPIAGVPVQIEQTVTTWEAACPVSGRCPPASALSSAQSTATSDLDGLVTIVPSEVGDVPALTSIAVIAGNAGFATISLEKHP